MKVIVLGGGVVGISTAYYLARAGVEVQVLERVRQVGPNREGARGSYTVYHLPV